MSRALVALVVLLAVPTPAAASDQVIYMEAQGLFLVGVPAPAEGVNAVSFVITPVENHTRLRFALGFDPEGVAVDTAAVGVTVRYRMFVELSDPVTGAALPQGSFRFDRNGTASYVSETPVRATIWLSHGADVAWTLRVSALNDPIPV